MSVMLTYNSSFYLIAMNQLQWLFRVEWDMLR